MLDNLSSSLTDYLSVSVVVEDVREAPTLIIFDMSETVTKSIEEEQDRTSALLIATLNISDEDDINDIVFSGDDFDDYFIVSDTFFYTTDHDQGNDDIYIYVQAGGAKL